MTNVSDFIDDKYKEYAYYVLNNRAIPSIRDGLKPVQRRILWTGKNYASEPVKVSNLAGACLKIHPHGDTALASAISNMAQDFCGANNHPLLEGKGAFGGKVMGSGNGIGAPRYVSVKINKFSKNVIFKDFDLVNEISNYDGEYTEAENFLPLIPIVLLNGIQGIAVGFACEIQPYNLKTIVEIQKDILSDKKITSNLIPYYKGFNGKISWDSEKKKFCSTGIFKKEGDFLRITELPIGYTCESYLKILDTLLEKDKIKDYVSDSKKEFDFKIYFKTRKILQEMSDNDISNMFKLSAYLNENLTLLDVDNKLKIYTNPLDILKDFTSWRFSFFKKRYEKLKEKLLKENASKKELLKFIIFILKNDYLNKMSKQSSKETRKDLEDSGFVEIDYLMSIGVSSFNKDKLVILKEQIEENDKKISEFVEIINSEKKQKEIYIKELNELLKEFGE